MLWLVALLAVAAYGHAPNTGPPPADELAGLPGRWDAGWYIGIAHGGYRWDQPDHGAGRIAFFPGYPLALRAVGRALRLPGEEAPWLWAGVAISTIFFAIGLFYVWQIARSLADPDAATRAVWLLTAYPFSLFYGQVYTESLFLAASAGAWYLGLRGRYAGSALWGLVAGLTRPIGFLVALPVAWAALTRWRRGEIGARDRVWTLLSVAAPALGLLAYATYIKLLTGSWLGWMTAQERWGRQGASFLPVISGVLTSLRDLGPVDYLLARPYETANALAALFIVVAIGPTTQRLGLGAGLFVASGLVIPLWFGGLVCLGRFTSVLFPVFIWLASTTRTPALPVAFAMLQGFFAALFFTDRGIF